MRKRKTHAFALACLLVLCIVMLGAWQNQEGIRARAQGADDEDALPGAVYIPLLMNDYVELPDFTETPFGIEFNPSTYQQTVPKIAQAGSSYTRLNAALWGQVEPQEGQRNWSALSGLEAQLKFAAENNLQAILVVRDTPDWAQKTPGYSCGAIKADKLAAFGDFLYDLVARYSAAPYFIKYWELFNEPDVAPELVKPSAPYGCWGDAGDAYYGGEYFAEMLKVAYPKIKQADPNAEVITGGFLLSCNPETGNCKTEEEITASKFFEGVLINQGGDYFDGVGFHSYESYKYLPGVYFNLKWDTSWDTTGPVVTAKARFLKELLEGYGVSGKFIMNTETALICGTADTPPGTLGCESPPDSPYELTKANYIAESYAAAIAEGLRANIWYRLKGWRNSGLVYDDLKPRPAYDAYQFAEQRLGGAAYLGPIESVDAGGDDNLFGYKFLRTDGREVWVIWALDRLSHSFTLSESPLAAWDVLGKDINLATPPTLEITLIPHYIEWAP